MDRASTRPAVSVGGYPSAEVDGSDRVRFLHHSMPVALLSPAIGALAFTSYPLGANAVIAAFIAVVLVVLAATDLERRIIPNRIVIPAVVAVLIGRVVLSPDHSFEFVLAATGAGIVFLIPNLINPSLMGMGDVKLVMLLGAGLGSGVVTAVMLAFISVFPVAVATLIRGGLAARRKTLPFGPFLALAGLVGLIVPHLFVLG